MRADTQSRAAVAVAGMSKSVIDQITKNGGSFTKTAVPTKPSTKPKAEKASK
jgi:hypothetical protein